MAHNRTTLSRDHKMIKRTLSKKVLSLAKQFPVVSIMGPRQSGKTTLAKMVFDHHDYVNLEDPEERDFALSDPKGFLRRFAKGAILDEIQKAPSLLSYIQRIVDVEDLSGRFILTGSHQIHLMEKVSQTLAGRTAIVYLLPFSLDELLGESSPDPLKIDTFGKKRKKPRFTLEEIQYQGFYPRIHDRHIEPHDWLSAYYRTYVERDVRDVANIGDLDAFQRFIRLCAGRTGQLLNLSSLGADCGISHTTARHWISILQAGFIIHLLPPHHINFTKRLVKSPKLYFLDTGLLCYLLRIPQPQEILTHAMKGAIFETFVFSEIYKAFAHRGEIPPLYFWRDRTGHEVDFLIDAGNRLIPVEVKAGETVVGSLLEGVRYYQSLGPPVSLKGVLIHGGDSLYQRENHIIRPWYQCV